MVKNEDSKKFFPPSFAGNTTLPEFSVKYEIYWYSDIVQMLELSIAIILDYRKRNP